MGREIRQGDIGESVKETPAQDIHTSAPDRRRLLKRIGDARNSTVIAYITQVKQFASGQVLPDDVRILERHFQHAIDNGSRNIDLLICTTGGAGTVPWDIHSTFREHFPKGKLGVFVPYIAYSSGTLICLGSDELILGKRSVLGPVDGQGPEGPSASNFEAFLALLDALDPHKKISPQQKLDALTRNASPLKIGEAYRLLQEDRRVTLNALASRRSPLSDRANRQIARYFLHSVGEHCQGIRRREAQKAGVSFITPIESTGLEGVVDELFSRYADAMQLFARLGESELLVLKGQPVFDPEGLEPLAVIESCYETNAGYPIVSEVHLWDRPSDGSASQGLSKTDWGMSWTSSTGSSGRLDGRKRSN